MKINDLEAYIKHVREKRFEVEGMTVADFAVKLDMTPRTARSFVAGEVAAGRLKLNGKRAIKTADERTSYAPVYIIVPHEVSQSPEG